MKKTWPVFCLLALSLTLAGCGSGAVQPLGDESYGISSSGAEVQPEQKENTVDKPLPKPPEPEEEPIPSLTFGETVSLPFAEITIEGASVGDEIIPDQPKRVYRYSDDIEGETYFYLYGTIKNVSGDEFEFADNMYAAMCFDGKYNYDAYVSADEGGTFTYIYAYLAPLKSEKFYIIASVPDELIEQYQQVEVKFGFLENFEREYNLQENECDYLYSVSVSR